MRIAWKFVRVIVALVGYSIYIIWMFPIGFLFLITFMIGIPIWSVLDIEDKTEKILFGATFWPMTVTKIVIDYVDNLVRN